MWSIGIKKANKRSDAGFTLLELLIVMGVVAVVTLAAVPAWQQFSRSMTLRAAALQLASLLRYAQLNAIETSEERYVRVDFGAGVYRLLPLSDDSDAGSDDAEADAALASASHWEVARPLPPSVQAALAPDDTDDADAVSEGTEDASDADLTGSDSIEVTFRPDGTATPVILELVSGSQAYRISVRGATGAVSVERHHKE